MPKFYFHLHNDEHVPDASGKELADLDAARTHAVSMARFEVSEAAKRDGRIVLSHHIDVANAEGAVLASVHFRDAVEVTP